MLPWCGLPQYIPISSPWWDIIQYLPITPLIENPPRPVSSYFIFSHGGPYSSSKSLCYPDVVGCWLVIGYWRILQLLHKILQLNFACFLRELCPSIIILLSLYSILPLLQFLMKTLCSIRHHIPISSPSWDVLQYIPMTPLIQNPPPPLLHKFLFYFLAWWVILLKINSYCPQDRAFPCKFWLSCLMAILHDIPITSSSLAALHLAVPLA